jgi:hypothetical protein
MKYQVELSIVGACGGYSKIPAKHAPAVGNSVLNSPINILGSGSVFALKAVPRSATQESFYEHLRLKSTTAFEAIPTGLLLKRYFTTHSSQVVRRD